MALSATISSGVPLTWTPYAEPGTFLLALLLGIIAIGLILAARGMKKPIQLPRPRRILKVVILILWILSLGLIHVIDEETQNAVSYGPILPITLTSAAFTFVYLAYITRKGGIVSALGNGFIGAVAGPMVFEFPFALIAIPLLKLGARVSIFFFGTLFVVIFTTLALLLFSKRTAITKYSLFSLSTMFLIFAVWALEGFSYPSTPISFTLNAVSKVLSFTTIIAMFSGGERKEERHVSQGGMVTKA